MIAKTWHLHNSKKNKKKGFYEGFMVINSKNDIREKNSTQLKIISVEVLEKNDNNGVINGTNWTMNDQKNAIN